MADNYLEKRYLECFGPDSTPKRKVLIRNQSIDNLLLKNRSYRAYDQSYKVSMEELREIVSVAAKVPSARNQQALRFKLVTSAESAPIVESLHLGGALPELHLPHEGSAPEAFIIVCSVASDRYVDIDLGIVAQSMLLKAVDMNLGGICIGAFDKELAMTEYGLPSQPILMIAIGKPAEKIQLISVKDGDSLKYYRKSGIHFVPKLSVDDLII